MFNNTSDGCRVLCQSEAFLCSPVLVRGKGDISILNPQSDPSPVSFPWISWHCRLSSLAWLLFYWGIFWRVFSVRPPWSERCSGCPCPEQGDDGLWSPEAPFNLSRSVMLWSRRETGMENKGMSVGNTVCSWKEIPCRTNKCRIIVEAI